MKVAYVTVQDSTNVRSFSGTGYYVPQSLEMNGAQVHYIGKLKTKPYLVEKLKETYFEKIQRKRYWFNRNPRVIKNFGEQALKRLENVDYDVALSISSIPMARMKTDKPIVYWMDAVFADIIDFYPEFTNMAGITLREGQKMEQEALERCTYAVFSSQWAADGAMKHYNIDPAKVKVIHYGANIDRPYEEGQVDEIIHARPVDHCKLLFAGVDWARKGGDTALQVAQTLNDQGIRTELHLLGSQPDNGQELPEFVVNHGFISKESQEGRDKIHQIISNAHFLILPTKADCTPIVFAEFNSYGIPCLTTDIGGIPSLIKNGVNGHMFGLNAPANAYADYIESVMEDEEAYHKLAQSSYQEYKNKLNWKVAGEKMMELLKEIT